MEDLNGLMENIMKVITKMEKRMDMANQKHQNLSILDNGKMDFIMDMGNLNKKEKFWKVSGKKVYSRNDLE